MSNHKDLKKSIERVKAVQGTPRPIIQTRKVVVPESVSLPKATSKKEVVEEVKLNRLIRKEERTVSGKIVNVPGCNNYF